MTDPSWKTQKTKPRSLPFASAGAELLFSAHLPLPGRGENDHPLNTHLPTHVSAQQRPPSRWPLLPTGLGAQGVSTSVAVGMLEAARAHRSMAPFALNFFADRSLDRSWNLLP